MSSAPHTPTGDNSPLPLFTSTNTNRYSTDSWNSSNYDAADDEEWEWKSEQVRLLNRTLDNLPAHLLTPFNGPVPPSNLLDKIARGVARAKGPIDWPHSLRATRAKIVELARLRAKEGVDGGDTTDTIAEEESMESDGVPLKQTTNTGPTRPLYRQSSMDFMQTTKVDIKDNDYIHRLSRRLQRTDRILDSPFHPYARRPSSPGYGSLRPSTPSSATLNSTTSSSRPFRMKRSMSSLSSLSSCSSDASRATDPRVQRIIRSESFAGSSRSPLKRAPSFGTRSRDSLDSVAMSVDRANKDSDVTSSDEEEKLRSRKSKRARTKAASPTPPPMTPLMSPATTKAQPRTRAKVTSKSPPVSAKSPTVPDTSKSPSLRPTKRRANVRRNPSILGPELPNPQPKLEPPASIITPYSPPRSPSTVESPNPYFLTHIPTFSPGPAPPSTTRSLRRSKPSVTIPRAAPSRIIAFSDIPPTSPEKPGVGTGLGLGSAFQLN
ncbi:hypothetical protein BXZ70DRAFT_1000093 [Cristinia sonorae]|uniref:Uncharacterized protein n=1 Tax=Cristinia sonorae TaxID=1940300 RepID=A0A8K0UR11_9AGAR|nr:hypothetical protein BXZ70DRAFT_1000093 [Cristinia sonorae]